LAGGPLVLNSSADDLPNMQRSTPLTPEGWTVTVGADPANQTATGSAEYTGGPQVPKNQGDGGVTPHGGGSLTLRVGDNQNSFARANHAYLDGSPVGGIDVEYSWITTERPGTPIYEPGAAAPSLRLAVKHRGATGNDAESDDTLTYEPYFNRGGATLVGQWFRDDAGAGRWWATSSGQETLFTLQQYQETHPGAVVATQPGGSFSVTVGWGSAEWQNFEGSVDDVLLQRSGSTVRTTYDFDPTVLDARALNTQPWTFPTTTVASSPNPATVMFVAGPPTPFFGVGSMRLAVGSRGENSAQARKSDLDGGTLGDIEALSYGTYVRSRLSSIDCAEAPYLTIDMFTPASAGTPPLVPATPEARHRLIFHPCDQSAVPLGKWQRWDALTGIWRWEESDSAKRTSINSDPESPQCSGTTCRGNLAEFGSAYPNAEIADTTSDGGSLRIGAGGGAANNPNAQTARWDNFVGYADFLTADLDGESGRTYDFDGSDADPSTPPGETGGTGSTSTTSTTVRRSTTTTRPDSGSTTTTTADPDGNASASVGRLEGADRFDTAIEVSQSRFDDDAADAVVLARGDDYPDALAATPLAVNRRGPLLLTWPSDLEARVEDEIRRVLPDGGTVHIAGGPVAVGPAVEARLEADGFHVIRHNGRNRFETATLIAEQVSGASIAFLATGTNFADALPSGAAAGAEGGVVLLTAGSSMPPETAAYLNARPNVRRVAVGGQAAAADPGAERIVGDDRFATAAAVARRFFPDATAAAVANGTHFADALAGGPHIGSRGGPLLLTRIEALPEAARQWLVESRDSLANVYIYGGPNAVSPTTEGQIRSATS
jgi:putative cell wall-binding protein